MNRKQRARKLERRRNLRSGPSAATLAYNEISERAEREGKGESFVLTQMQQRGYLPTGTGGWRGMSEREKEIWK